MGGRWDYNFPFLSILYHIDNVLFANILMTHEVTQVTQSYKNIPLDQNLAYISISLFIKVFVNH
jgi:hypothetical protein